MATTGLDRLVPQRSITDDDRPRTRATQLLHEACVEALADSEFPIWSVRAKALLLYLIKMDDDTLHDWARLTSTEVEDALRAKYPELYRAVAEVLDSNTQTPVTESVEEKET